MQLVLLSGGSGRRLWPLSNDARSKQFIRVLDDSNGMLESMVQRVYRQLTDSGMERDVLISTNALQKDTFQSQISSEVSIIVEPQRRDTFAAIALSCAFLFSEKKCDKNEPIIVLPCDQFVDESYFKCIKTICEVVDRGSSDIVLMGIKPNSPAIKYGYIIPSDQTAHGSMKVKCFKEKPDHENAIRYISQNALWNGGVFGFKLGYLLEILQKYIGNISYENVLSNFEKLPKISFDYEVVEKAKSVEVVPYDGLWEDLGTWNSLLLEIKRNVIGKGIITASCANTNIINELNIPVICSGVSNVAVVSSYDGILVVNKSDSENLKPYVESIVTRPLYEERRWGTYKVIDQQTFNSGLSQLTKQIKLNPGKSISYQSHQQRDEILTIVDGDGLFVLDGLCKKVGTGDVLDIKAGQKHAIKACSELTMIEVQLGKELFETDIERFDIDREQF